MRCGPSAARAALHSGPPRAEGLDKGRIRFYSAPEKFKKLFAAGNEEIVMAHKKVERKKEIDRRRQRREQRLKARIKEAKAAARQ
jgi:hypothetical protein